MPDTETGKEPAGGNFLEKKAGGHVDKMGQIRQYIP